MVDYLRGSEPISNIKPTTQVYKATHEGGGKRLPFAKRSFISFSYGGKVIEDFNLIAYTNGDSVERQMYGNFEDITETYDVIDGQFYWGTHFTNNTLSLDLVSDSIDDRTLDDFKEWFKPGVARELVLAEHPNRAIMARISEPPTFSLMPFEKKISKKIAGQVYDGISVTEYKGTIKINFVTDDPFWYARYNVLLPYMNGEGALGVIPTTMEPELLKELVDNNFSDHALYVTYKDNDRQIQTVGMLNPQITIKDGYWTVKSEQYDRSTIELAYPEEVISLIGGADTLSDKDFLKVVIEDNIPHLNMIQDDILLGENLYISETPESRIFNTTNYETENKLAPHAGARIGDGLGYVSILSSKIMTPNLEITPTSPGYLYYAGTAPSKPIIEFTFYPHIDSEGYYIVEPFNSNFSDSGSYSYLAIDDEYFYFTTPAILTAYNQAIKIVREFPVYGINSSSADLMRKIRENVNDYYTRAWAIKCLNLIVADEALISQEHKDKFCDYMKAFLYGGEGTPNPVKVIFNSQTGEAFGYFKIQIADQVVEPRLPIKENGQSDYSTEGATTILDFPLAPGFFYTAQKTIIQNVGDMIKSHFLLIQGRNYPNHDGFVTKKDCHVISTNYSSGLQNVKITFKNLYY